MIILLLFLFCCGTVLVSGQKNPHFIENRSTIVHLFEWKWKDIGTECENFLAKKGYAGVQISPPNENLIIHKRPWYERYQPISYNLTTRSGDEKDFEEMTTKCNKAGVRIFVDTIINHMAAGNGVGTAGNKGQGTERSFPAVPFTKEHFHIPCPIQNYNNATEVRVCELVGLKDLDQSKEYVREKIIEFMNHLIDLGVAGFRIDAAKHMHPDDLGIIYNRLKNLNEKHAFPRGSRAFIYQEVAGLGGPGDAISREEYQSIGRVLEFHYGNRLSNVFLKNDKLRYLDSWGPQWGLVRPESDALTFIDNHDNQRTDENIILTYKKSKPYKMATAFMLAHPYGVGRIMSSFDFVNSETPPPQDSNYDLISPGFKADGTCTNGYICEHRWRQIMNMVKFRNVVSGTDMNRWQTLEDQQIGFCRGNKGFVVFNNGGTINREMDVCVPEGEYCDIISGDLINGKCTGKLVKVDRNSKARIFLGDDEEDGVMAIHIYSKMK